VLGAAGVRADVLFSGRFRITSPTESISVTAKIGRLCAVFLLIAGILVAPSTVFAQGSDSVQVNWRSHAEAVETRDAISGRISEIGEELAEIETELSALSAELSVLSHDEGMATERLADAQAKARELAVEAYIIGSSAELGSFLLGSGSAADLTYMSFLLEEHAETTLEAGRAYVELRENATSGVVELSDRIDVARARQGELAGEAAKLTAALPAAEHRVYISAIYAQGDESLARSGRADPTTQQWEALRFCESTMNYGISSGNGFYGAYQFTVDTWYTVGGTSSPDVASPEEQDARARLLFARRGSQPWPICGRYLP
jgi:hypothetical protein